MKAGRKPKPKPVTLPGAQGRQVEIVQLQDPFELPGKLAPVARAVNHSPLDYMLARDRLHGAGEAKEDGEARHRAGTRLQGIYERAGGAGARAIDYTRVRVDTSLNYAGTPEAQAIALKELGAIRSEVGEERYDLLHAVCCEQISLFQWLNPSYRREDKLQAYLSLQQALDGLMAYFGVAVGKRSDIRVFHVEQFTGEENRA